MADSLRPHGLYISWNSPAQNTGVGIVEGVSPLLQGILPNPGIKLWSPALPVDSLSTELSGTRLLKLFQLGMRRRSRAQTCGQGGKEREG